MLDCGAHPTREQVGHRVLKQGKTHRQSGYHITIRLQDQVANPRVWPTPTSGRADQEMSPSQMKRNSLNLAQTVQVKEGLWPTPTAQDGKNNGGPSQHERNTKPLNAAVNGTLSLRLDRMADGLSAWMDEPCPRTATGQKQRAARLKGLGNAVIPQIPEMIGYAILEACHD